ncbi:MAG: hypothetical protein JRJ45_01885 [Deltaproteobacteria bacterium]|nr:hypothetical protein [Deltaproteobacteria bacterium]
MAIRIVLTPTSSHCIETVAKREYWKNVNNYLKKRKEGGLSLRQQILPILGGNLKNIFCMENRYNSLYPLKTKNYCMR